MSSTMTLLRGAGYTAMESNENSPFLPTEITVIPTNTQQTPYPIWILVTTIVSWSVILGKKRKNNY